MENNLIFFIIDYEYHGYVLRLSNMKSSSSKQKFFNAKLHDGDMEKNVISYNPKLFPILEKAQLSDKAVKITNFTESLNDFEKEMQLKLGHQSIIEYSSKTLPFENIKDLVMKCKSFSSLYEILHELCMGSLVNVDVYVDVEGCQETEVNTKYGKKLKKDVRVYDNSISDEVRLTIWNNHIDLFKESSVYKIKDLRINVYKGKYLTTTGTTVAKVSDSIIKERKLKSIEKTAVVTFPAEYIDNFEKTHFCK